MRILITTIRKCGKGESSCLTKKLTEIGLLPMSLCSSTQ